MEKISLSEIYGLNVFNDAVMQERLPKKVYQELKSIIKSGTTLSASVAEVVANAMKDWAIDKGATHYTHWFQPMTGVTAEKHEAFLTPDGMGGAIAEFSGKELIKGESDASSFPSGGLRSTFEARGYTAWDCTSPAFLKEDASGLTLCIPTVFCSYTGEALDKKTPLLRANDALNHQALRILRLFGDTQTQRVEASVGAEQEYFLIDKEMYKKRKDIIFTGRTLFGAMPPKGQELDDHYYGTLRERVSLFMHELNRELWKLGIPAKTQHNEVAPCQHELAPIFTNANTATDNNQLIMETMKRVAPHFGLVCLLNEKPFAGVNGSGKHDNWSMATDTGKNLLDPGKNPHENKLFLLLLVAVLKAVDVHADLLRVSAACPGNDHRLGAQEAPPAIISIFLGDQLEDILQQIDGGCLSNSIQGEEMSIGASTLPSLKKDVTDRNRTSPFAFTGNKFEFRMVGSSDSIACPNYIINTIVADSLCDFADRLEKAKDFDSEVMTIIQETIREHKRIVFNGNGYSEEWVKEAERRGLPNITCMLEAIPAIRSEKAIALFEKHGVLTREECEARAEILYEEYAKQIIIEAKSMVDIVMKQISPAALTCSDKVAQTVLRLKEAGVSCDSALHRLQKLTEEQNALDSATAELSAALEKVQSMDQIEEAASYCRHTLFPLMAKVRKPADALEFLVDKKDWPFPTYGDLLYYID